MTFGNFSWRPPPWVQISVPADLSPVSVSSPWNSILGSSNPPSDALALPSRASFSHSNFPYLQCSHSDFRNFHLTVQPFSSRISQCNWLYAHGSRPNNQETVSYYLVVEIPNSVRFIRAESGKIGSVLDTDRNYPVVSSVIITGYSTHPLASQIPVEIRLKFFESKNVYSTYSPSPSMHAWNLCNHSWNVAIKVSSEMSAGIRNTPSRSSSAVWNSVP
jgi:hypothetical protein